MSAPEKTQPELDYLLGELRHLYDEEAAKLAQIEEAGRAQRERFKEARDTLDATASEIGEAEAEREGLAQKLVLVQLSDEPEAERAVKDRYRELTERIEGEASRRGEALEMFKFGDPWQAESAFHQAQSAKAEKVMREAEETRARLMEALDGAFRDLDEKANRVRQMQRVHNSLRAARGGS